MATTGSPPSMGLPDEGGGGFERTYARWVVKWRWLLLVLGPLLVVLAASGAVNIKFTGNYRVFFSADNPQLLAFEALENVYQKNDGVMFVVTPPGGEVFERETVEALSWLTTEAWQTPYSSRVDSITNFQHTEAEEDDLLVADLVADQQELTDSGLARLRAIALKEPLLAGRLLSHASDVAAVNVTVQMPGIDEATENPEVTDFARELRERFLARYPLHDVRLTGMVVMNNQFTESTKMDMKTLVPASFGVMVLCLALMLRGLVGTAGTVLVIAMSVLTAIGLGGYSGMPLSPPSAIFPTIVLTIAMANCVHVMVSWVQGYANTGDKRAAIQESLRVNLQPVALASFTTALGFLCMNFSDVPPFNHLGNFVALGVAASFVLSVTFLPAFVTIVPTRRPKPRPEGKPTLMHYVGDFVVRYHRALLWGMLVLVIGLIAAVPRNELNDIFVEYFDERVPFRQDTDYTTERLTGLYTVEYSLSSGESNGISAPEFLGAVENFANWFRAQEETRHVNVVTDVFKRLNKNMHGDNPEYYKLPGGRELAAQYLLLYEMSLPYGLDLNNQIDIDKSSTRMTVSIETLSSNEMIALDNRAQAWLAENEPSIADTLGSGSTLMFANIGSRNIRSMLLGTTLALVLISLTLILALRSWKLGLLSMVPNLVPGLMGFGLWGLFVGEIGLGLSVVSSMTLGIVVDDTVHFMSKYRRARTEYGCDASEAVRYAFRTVGTALLTTSVVLVAGFLVLSQSSFEINSGMGLLTAIVIALALLADFLLLPPLLIKLEGSNDADFKSADDAATRSPAGDDPGGSPASQSA